MLELTLISGARLSAAELAEVREFVGWRLNLDEDLRPFYAGTKEDPVMSASVKHNSGAKIQTHNHIELHDQDRSGRHKTSVETFQRLAHALGVRLVVGFESGPAYRGSLSVYVSFEGAARGSHRT